MGEPKIYFEEWYKKFEPSIQKNTLKYKKQYLHLDDKISKPQKNINPQVEASEHKRIYKQIFDELISDPEKVSHWQFLPFIKQELPKFKYKTDKNGIKKKDGSKKRPIMYCGHKDRLLYTYYCILLEKEYENRLNIELSNSILAYRRITKDNEKGKSNLDFAKAGFEKIVELREYGDIVALAYDIDGFFDNLNHDQLKSRWSKILQTEILPSDHYKVYKSLTKFSFFNREELLRKVLKLVKPRLKYKKDKKNVLDRLVTPKGRFKKQTSVGRFELYGQDGQVFNSNTYINFREILRVSKEKDKILEEDKINGYSQKERYIFETRTKSKKGIPQGSPISGLLSNIYMLDFDISISKFLSQPKYEGVYYRYSDDILILIKKEFVAELEKFINQEITKLKLEIKKEKTKRVLFAQNSQSSFEVDTNGQIVKNRVDKPKHLKLQYLGLEFDGKKIFIRSSSICKSLNKANYSIKRYFTKVKKSVSSGVFKKSLVNKLTHLGNMNFYRYAVKKKANPNKIFDNEVNLTFKKQLKKYQKTIFSRIYN